MGETAAGGAVIGAGIGLLIGALGGKPGEGLAAGAMLGGAQGAYEGWRQDQDDKRTREITDAIRDAKTSGAHSPNSDAASRAREELTRLLGVWSFQGWALVDDEQKATIRGKAHGTVEMSNFLQIALMDIEVDGMDVTIWGETLLGYDDDVGYTYSSRINTIPEPFNATGTFDAVSRTFTFGDGSDHLTIRFESPDRFFLETREGSQTSGKVLESYTFTRS